MMIFSVCSKRSRKAFTITELAIVLGIMGIVLAAVWLAASTVWKNHQMYRAQEQMVTLVQNIRDTYGLSGRVLPATQFTTTTAPDFLNLIPSDMVVNGTTFKHAFGGAFELWPVTIAPAVVASHVEIRLRNLSRSDCIKFLMEFPVLAPEVGVRRIGTTVGTALVDLATISDPGGGITLPLTLAQTSTWCNTDNANEVRIAFRLRN